MLEPSPVLKQIKSLENSLIQNGIKGVVPLVQNGIQLDFLSVKRN